MSTHSNSRRAPPITYMHGERQYIVVATGGSDHPPKWVAFALP